MPMVHAEKLDKNKIKFIGFISFLMGFAQAVLAYVMSSYLKLSSGTENLGIYYLAAYGISVVIFFNLHKVVSKIGKSQVFLFSIFAKIPVLALLVLLPPSYTGALIILLYIIAGNISWVALDMILEHCSLDHLSGRIRGIHLTVMNSGILLGPFLSTRVLDMSGFAGIFRVMIVLYALILVMAMIKLRDVRCEAPRFLNVRELLAKIKKRKNVLRAYYISFALEFFYALMLIYTPIYLRDLGISWSHIGIIFTIMLVPFILLQYPAGLLADKRLGEKELLIFAIFMMGGATATLYFISSTSIVVWAVALFATRIGASLIEILRDSYFYKRIESLDIDLIDFFRTAQAAAYIAASIISFLFLAVFSLKAIFILTAIVAFSALYPAIRLVDNKSEREMATS